MTQPAEHERWMREAIAEARLGGAAGNIPVGSVVVRDGAVVARGHNEALSAHDPTAHAETVAIRRAGAALGAPVLAGCTVYTTLEPCPMCAAACALARVERVVIGALVARSGAVRSRLRLLDDMVTIVRPALPGPIEVVAEVLREECLAVLPPDLRAAIEAGR
jgi:tRNA(adenine34) deaminase